MTQPNSASSGWQQALRNDPRPIEDLISLALTATDEGVAWRAVMVLHHRGSREVLEAAERLCRSACPQERELGANILGQLGVPDRSFPDDSVEILLALLAREQEADVLEAVGIALGHHHDSRAIEPLARLCNHPSPEIRYAVVHGLTSHEDERAIQALIELSADEDIHVRDWATFGLGTQIDVDSPAIREALLRRLSDSDEVTRGEALVGLARRGDERVIEPLNKELASGVVGALVLEAAGLMGIKTGNDWYPLDE